MIMSQQTGTTRPRHPLHDSARSFLAHALWKGIRAIRRVLDRHRSGQHANYTYARTPTQKHGMQRHGCCFMPFLIPNRHGPYAANQNRALGKDRFWLVVIRMSGRRTEAASLGRETKEKSMLDFTWPPIMGADHACLQNHVGQYGSMVPFGPNRRAH